MSQLTENGMTVQVKGRYGYAFTMISNLMRDELMPTAGTDAFSLAYLILSWAGDGERGAQLGARYLRATTGWTASRAEKAKELLLAHYPMVFNRVEGVKETSTPETWWVDFDVLTQMHADYLVREKERRGNRRKPGRPKKPVRGIDTGFTIPENPVREINTGFSGLPVGFGGTLFGKSVHPCSGNQHSPVRETGTHKEISKDMSTEGGGVGSGTRDRRSTPGAPPSPSRAPGPAPVPYTTTSPDENRGATQVLTSAPPAVLPPDSGAADAAVTDLDLELLFGPATDEQETRAVPEVPEVPRAAPSIVVDELVPVPPIELVRRVRAASGEGRYRLVVSLIGGKKAVQGGILEELTPSGALPRLDWLKLEEEELLQVRETAQAEAQATGINFQTLAIRGLDRMIGAPTKRKGPRNGGEGFPLPGAYLTPEEKQARVALFPSVEAGQQWQGRRSGQRYTIADVTSQTVIVEGLGEYAFQKFHQLFMELEG